MLSSIGRAAIGRGGGSYQTVARVSGQCRRVFVAGPLSQQSVSASSHTLTSSHRAYATASTTAVKTRKTATKSPTSTPKPKAAKKATKATKAKPGPKPKKKEKPVAKPKKPAKKPLSEAAKDRRVVVQARAEIKELRAKALLDPPKKLPENAWGLTFTRIMTGSHEKLDQMNEMTKSAAQQYKDLSASEREGLNHEANANKATNQAAYEKWIESHSPNEVKAANAARRNLNRKREAAHTAGKRAPGAKLQMLQDSRQVKRPVPARIAFNAERFRSGDFQGIALTEAAKEISKEWKAMSESERQPYLDTAEAEKRRYFEEAATVYGSP